MKTSATPASICERLRAIQERDGVEFTDDEVKAIICGTLNDRALRGIEDWEARVVEYAARAIRERGVVE